MISRRYRTSLHVLGSPWSENEPRLSFDVEAARSLAPAQIDRDLEECKKVVRAYVPTGAKISLALVGGADPALLDNLTKTYTSCMEPRGYRVARWQRKG